MVTNPAERAMKEVLERNGIPLDLILRKMDMYNKCREMDDHEP
jgi:hypothetical protein